MMKILNIKPYSPDWFMLRRDNIGASDVPVILNLEKRKSPLQLYLEKKEIIPVSEMDEFAEWGHRTESIIAQKFSEKNEIKLFTVDKTYQSSEKQFLIGTPDRLIYSWKDGLIYSRKKIETGLEIKNVSSYRRDEFFTKVPDSYFIQCQMYMYILEKDYYHLAYLIDGHEYNDCVITRDDSLIKIVLDYCEKFHENMMKNTMPEANENDNKILQELFKVAIDREIYLPEEFDILLQMRDNLKKQIKELEERTGSIENKIKKYMGNNTRGKSSYYFVSWKPIREIDEEKLKGEYPEEYKKCITENLSIPVLKELFPKIENDDDIKSDGHRKLNVKKIGGLM